MATINKDTNKHPDNEVFESDTEKVVHRHLQDPNHAISDEEMQGVRIGMTPPMDESTKEALTHPDEKIADVKTDDEDDSTPGGQKLTPWDVTT